MRKIIYCSIPEYGYMPLLRMDGPILPPRSMPAATVMRMIRNGHKVYEHNPKNPSEKVLLTVTNFNDEKFNAVSAPEKAVISAKIDVPTYVTNPTLEYVAKVGVDVVEEKVEAPAEGQVHLTKAQRRALRRQQQAEEAARQANEVANVPVEEEAPVVTETAPAADESLDVVSALSAETIM